MATDYSAGTPWDYAKKNPSGNIVDKELDWQDFGRDDIVGQELNRPSSAFTKVQRYPGGYGSSSAPSGPSRPGGGGFGGGGFGSGSFTFNPTFNVTSSNVNTAGGGGGAIGSITDSTVGDIETGADTTTKGPIKTTSAESGTTAANTFLENITDSVISDTANPIQTPIVTASNQAPSSIAAALTNQTSDTATNQNIPDNLGTITNTGETTSTTNQTAENTATSTQNLNETAQELINEIENPQGPGGDGTGGPGPIGPEPIGPEPIGPEPIGPEPIGPEPIGPEPIGPEPIGPEVPGPTGPEGPSGPQDGPSGTPELIDKYNIILGREPDEAGLQYWEDELATRTAAGEDRGDVLDNITQSFQAGDEFLNRELAQQLDNQIVPNEERLDAWIGPGGGLTQSSDPTGQTYYEGVGSLEDYVDPDTEGAADQNTSDLFGLYQEKFDRNPDESGLQYWEEELATRTEAGEDYEDVLANIGQSFEEGAETELRDTLSSGQDLSATQDLNSTPMGFSTMTQEELDAALGQTPINTPADTPTTSDNPFGTDFPVYSQEELDAIFNPSASAPAPTPAPAVKETVPYYNVDFSDPSTYMNKEVDWTADWTKDTQVNNEKPWYEKDLTEFSWFK